MVNTRSKIKKTQKTFEASLSYTSMEDSDQQSTQSGASIGSNDDLLTQILLRLPVTSILRFKSVSQHWRWLLSHRSFTLRYDSLSKSPGFFTCGTYAPFDVEDRSTPLRTIDFCFDRYGIKIVQSCNGLLLCRSFRCDNGVRKYYVFNPTTKQYAIIPSVPGGQKVRKGICFMGLAFHQTRCVQYKVICIRRIWPEDGLFGEEFQVQIYSSDTKKWKISIESFPAHHATFDQGVYWNGALHWAPSCENHLYFKIDAEQLQSLPLPEEMMSDEKLAMYLGESRGHLHLIVTSYLIDNRLSRFHMNVYEMLSDYSGWFVKYHVQLDGLKAEFVGMLELLCFELKVVDVIRGENEEDTFIVLTAPAKIITYNVYHKNFKLIFDITRGYYAGLSRYHRYTEALTSF